ncbi:hypothetical protein Rsub_02320 [Raphidocelis subcapitata]|uniref:F-box domain-containing protein n=1 Tax=Raphidocelis subcapitata TaxID=307507 RepID=A0A2V0NSG4_9CHLO|nr:hypothetical protein Rsub_02320 [Raphidocelis subcapitata]|eukprot:GBF89602.1 hypothetical protein Rsub_02320 [Raphidocelis subcapitata]
MMSPTAQAAAAVPSSSDAAAPSAGLPNDVLPKICALLPPVDLVLTARRLNKALAATLAPRAAALRAEAVQRMGPAFSRFLLPLWALQEAWPQLTDAQRHGATVHAAFRGDLAALEWAVAKMPCPGMPHPGILLAGEVCAAAAAGGQLEALQCAHTLGSPWDSRTCWRAAQAGYLAMLRWARAQDPPCPWAASTCFGAACGGHLAVLQWARAQEPPCPWDAMTCSKAAEGGHLAVLQWARAQEPPCPWGKLICSDAAEGGHLAVLQWARAQEPPCPWDAMTCSNAARGGHLAVLQWARAEEPPCPWDEATCSAAAYGGHLAVLQWARAEELPCPWDEATCSAAAYGGHLAVLQWARAQQPPCPWNARLCLQTARRTCGPDAEEWIQAQAKVERVAL